MNAAADKLCLIISEPHKPESLTLCLDERSNVESIILKLVSKTLKHDVYIRITNENLFYNEAVKSVDPDELSTSESSDYSFRYLINRDNNLT